MTTEGKSPKLSGFCFETDETAIPVYFSLIYDHRVTHQTSLLVQLTAGIFPQRLLLKAFVFGFISSSSDINASSGTA